MLTVLYLDKVAMRTLSILFVKLNPTEVFSPLAISLILSQEQQWKIIIYVRDKITLYNENNSEFCCPFTKKKKMDFL